MSHQGMSLKPGHNKENQKVLQQIAFLVHRSRIQPGKGIAKTTKPVKF